MMENKQDLLGKNIQNFYKIPLFAFDLPRQKPKDNTLIKSFLFEN